MLQYYSTDKATYQSVWY